MYFNFILLNKEITKIFILPDWNLVLLIAALLVLHHFALRMLIEARSYYSKRIYINIRGGDEKFTIFYSPLRQ